MHLWSHASGVSSHNMIYNVSVDVRNPFSDLVKHDFQNCSEAQFQGEDCEEED